MLYCREALARVEAMQEYGISLINKPQEGNYNAIILAVAHNQFKALGVEKIRKYGKDNHVLYDIKYIFSSSEVDGRI